MQKDKEVVASYSRICYYFSMELFLLVSGSVQALHPAVLVQKERFPVCNEVLNSSCTLPGLSTRLWKQTSG